MADILIIDDDELICATLSNVVKDMGHNATCAFTLREGLEKVRSGQFDLVFLDVKMPDGSGLGIVTDIRETPSSPEVIIITGFGDPDGAELAIKHGAWGYLEKGASLDAMTLPLARALQYRQERQLKKAPTALRLEGIVGRSPKMRACLDLLAQAANSDASVLITGETGTGKELIACAIHKNSARARKSFVVVDCAALPETLVESVLFGHEKGSYTGADKSQSGLIKQAGGGTLFLDEVGELPLSIQGSFLRVLQERRFRPVGSIEEVESDFRTVAASNRDLDDMARRGQFRKDLLFRLRALEIELPPLRGRFEDIKELATYHMIRLSEHYGKGTKGFSPDFLETLERYDWPGNARELINAMERAYVEAGDSPVLFPKYLPVPIRVQAVKASLGNKETTGGEPDAGIDLPKGLSSLQEQREAVIAEAEQHYLKELVSLTGRNVEEACKISGLSRSRLYALMKKHRISATY